MCVKPVHLKILVCWTGRHCWGFIVIKLYLTDGFVYTITRSFRYPC